MENIYLKLCFNPPKPLQSKSGEKITYPGDFVENCRWHAVFSHAYNILGSTKLLIIECRLSGGDYLWLCPVRVTKSSPEVPLILFTSTLSIYSQGCCSVCCQTCSSIFISLPSASSIPFTFALFSSRLHITAHETESRRARPWRPLKTWTFHWFDSLYRLKSNI